MLINWIPDIDGIKHLQNKITFLKTLHQIRKILAHFLKKKDKK